MDKIFKYRDSENWTTEDGFSVCPLFTSLNCVWVYETDLYGDDEGGQWRGYAFMLPQSEHVNGKSIGISIELDEVDDGADVLGRMGSMSRKLMDYAAKLQIEQQARELKELESDAKADEFKHIWRENFLNEVMGWSSRQNELWNGFTDSQRHEIAAELWGK